MIVDVTRHIAKFTWAETNIYYQFGGWRKFKIYFVIGLIIKETIFQSGRWDPYYTNIKLSNHNDFSHGLSN